MLHRKPCHCLPSGEIAVKEIGLFEIKNVLFVLIVGLSLDIDVTYLDAKIIFFFARIAIIIFHCLFFCESCLLVQ